jgi:uncharacterized protein YqeY
MPILAQIEFDYEQAFKARKQGEVSTLRLLLAALKNERINKKADLDEQDIIGVIKREIKKRKEAIEDYEKGDRMDLATREKEEVLILERYMPAQMTADEIRVKVKEILAQLEEKDNVGKVIGKVMAEFKGLADGSVVRKIVEEELAK